MASDQLKFSRAIRQRARGFMEYLEAGEFSLEDSRDMETLMRYPELLESGYDESYNERPYTLQNEETYFVDFDHFNDGLVPDTGSPPPILERARELAFSGIAGIDAAGIFHRSTTPMEDPEGLGWSPPVVNGTGLYPASEHALAYSASVRDSGPSPALVYHELAQSIYNDLGEEGTWQRVDSDHYQQTHRVGDMDYFDPALEMIPTEGHFSSVSQTPDYGYPESRPVNTAPVPPSVAGYPNYLHYAMEPIPNNATSCHAAEVGATIAPTWYGEHTSVPVCQSTTDHQMSMKEVGIQYRRILDQQRLRDARLASAIHRLNQDIRDAEELQTINSPLFHSKISMQQHGPDNEAQGNDARASSDNGVVDIPHSTTSLEDSQRSQQYLAMSTETQHSRKRAYDDHSLGDTARSQRARLGAHPDGLSDEEGDTYRRRLWNKNRSIWQREVAKHIEHLDPWTLRVESDEEDCNAGEEDNGEESEEARDSEDSSKNNEDQIRPPPSLGAHAGGQSRCWPETDLPTFTGGNTSLPYRPRQRPTQSSPAIPYTYPLGVAASTPLPEGSISSVNSSPYLADKKSTIGLGWSAEGQNTHDMGRDTSRSDTSANPRHRLDKVPDTAEVMYDVELEDLASLRDMADEEWVDVKAEPGSQASDPQEGRLNLTGNGSYIGPVYATLRSTVERVRFYSRFIRRTEVRHAADEEVGNTARPGGPSTTQGGLMQQDGINTQTQYHETTEENRVVVEINGAGDVRRVEETRVHDNYWTGFTPINGRWELDDRETEEADL